MKKTLYSSIILLVLLSSALFAEDQLSPIPVSNQNSAQLSVTNLSQQTNTQVSNVPVENEKTIKFSVLGNTRTYMDTYSKFVNKILETSPDFVVNTGNCVNLYNNDNEWLQFKKTSKPLLEKTKYYAVPGNTDAFSTEFYRIFNLTKSKAYFAFPMENTQFIFLDANTLKGGDAQYLWLKQTLSDSMGYTFRVVFLHFPPISSGEYGGTISLEMMLKPIFNTYEVDLVFAGHESSYERLSVSNTRYIITGGGGAPLSGEGAKDPQSQIFKSLHHACHVIVGSKRIQFTAEALDGSVIDSFIIQK